MSADKRTLIRSLKISLFIWWFPYIFACMLFTSAGFDNFFREFSEYVWYYFIFGLIPIAIIYFFVYEAIKAGLLNKDPFSLKMSLFVTFMEFMLAFMYIIFNINDIFKGGGGDSEIIIIFAFFFLFVIPINFIFIQAYKLLIRAYKLLRWVISKIKNRNLGLNSEAKE